MPYRRNRNSFNTTEDRILQHIEHQTPPARCHQPMIAAGFKALTWKKWYQFLSFLVLFLLPLPLQKAKQIHSGQIHLTILQQDPRPYCKRRSVSNCLRFRRSTARQKPRKGIWLYGVAVNLI